MIKQKSCRDKLRAVSINFHSLSRAGLNVFDVRCREGIKDQGSGWKFIELLRGINGFES
jgi:hypothetical protein